jgi:hypothetical protein
VGGGEIVSDRDCGAGEARFFFDASERDRALARAPAGPRDDPEYRTPRRRRRSRSRGGGEFTAATIARARSRATPTRLARAHRDDWRHPSANERKAAAVRSSLRGVSRRARAVKTPRESDDDAFVSPSFRRARDARGRVVATASRPPLAAREDGPENRI